jgi:squalene-hopene/tetraprenyl-beta-curcumene cyclase
MLALLKSGRSPPRRDDYLRSVERLQAPSGGIRIFDTLAEAYNPVAPSQTARNLRALRAMGLPLDHPIIVRGTEWLLAEQQPDGSWFDFWFCDPIYGTALALEALVDLGVRERGHPDVERGFHRVLRAQNADGGWGFNFYGERIATSTVEHTAWAVHALCNLSRPSALPMDALNQGVAFLLNAQHDNGGWAPACIAQYDGIEGVANRHYPVVFALRALGAFRARAKSYVQSAPKFVRELERTEAKGSRLDR